MTGGEIFLVVEAVIYGLLGSTNLAFTRLRLSQVLGPGHQATPMDVFWQRDIGIFQLGLSALAIYTVADEGVDPRVALFVLGLVWTLGAVFLALTALYNDQLAHITSRTAGLGIAAISGGLAALNWVFYV